MPHRLTTWPPSPLFLSSLKRSSLSLSLVSSLLQPRHSFDPDPRSLPFGCWPSHSFNTPSIPPPSTPQPNDTRFSRGFDSPFDRCETLNDFRLNACGSRLISCTCRLVRIRKAYRAACLIDNKYIHSPGRYRRASLQYASPSRSRSGDEALPGSTGRHPRSAASSARAH